MTYKMQCPMCVAMMEIEAADDMEGMSKMKEAGKKHMMEMHKDMKMMTDEEMEDMIKKNWAKT